MKTNSYLWSMLAAATFTLAGCGSEENGITEPMPQGKTAQLDVYKRQVTLPVIFLTYFLSPSFASIKKIPAAPAFFTISTIPAAVASSSTCSRTNPHKTSWEALSFSAAATSTRASIIFDTRHSCSWLPLKKIRLPKTSCGDSFASR